MWIVLCVCDFVLIPFQKDFSPAQLSPYTCQSNPDNLNVPLAPSYRIRNRSPSIAPRTHDFCPFWRIHRWFLQLRSLHFHRIPRRQFLWASCVFYLFGCPWNACWWMSEVWYLDAEKLTNLSFISTYVINIQTAKLMCLRNSSEKMLRWFLTINEPIRFFNLLSLTYFFCIFLQNIWTIVQSSSSFPRVILRSEPLPSYQVEHFAMAFFMWNNIVHLHCKYNIYQYKTKKKTRTNVNHLVLCINFFPIVFLGWFLLLIWLFLFFLFRWRIRLFG